VDTIRASIKTGYQWAIDSFSLLKKKPFKWALLAFVYVILFLGLPVSPMTPVLFKIVIVVIGPIFLAVAIGLYREVDFGRNTPIGGLIKQIQPTFIKLGLLGVLCLAYSLIFTVLTNGDTTTLESFAKLGNSPIDVAKIWLILLKFFALLIPLLMATWFAPPIIAFQNASVLHAIKSSIAGSLKYALSLAVAWLVLTAAMMLVMLMLGILFAALFGVLHMQSMVLIGVVMTLSLLLATSWMLAFQYVCYRDIFDPMPVGGGEIAL
jgi:hypothetical protein